MDPRREHVELEPGDRQLVDRLVTLVRTARAIGLVHELRQRLDDRELEGLAWALTRPRGESGRLPGV